MWKDSSRLCSPPNLVLTKNTRNEMENGSERWRVRVNERLNQTAEITIRSTLVKIIGNLNKDDPRPTVPLGHGDPSSFPCFRTTPIAVDAVVDAVRSAKFNSYVTGVGILPARR